jgi:hypothetical protein
VPNARLLANNCNQEQSKRFVILSGAKDLPLAGTNTKFPHSLG